MFSIPSSNILSPEMESKGSLQRRIELQKVLKEADEFLQQPDVVYKPSQEPINIAEVRPRSPTFSIKTEVPKVESVRDFVKNMQQKEEKRDKSVSKAATVNDGNSDISDLVSRLDAYDADRKMDDPFDTVRLQVDNLPKIKIDESVVSQNKRRVSVL